MSDIIISKKNETSLNIDCDSGIMMELAEHFTFEVEGAKFSPAYKAKRWDGLIRLLDRRFGTLPVGLYNDLIAYASELGYTTECKKSIYGSPDDKTDVTREDIEKFAKTLNLHSNGKPIEVRDYQLDAVYNCIRNQRQISIVNTGGGKSLILFIIFRWFIENSFKRIMVVVPSLGLVKQMTSDFIQYSEFSDYKIKEHMQIISGSLDKNITKNLVICNWQAVFRQPPTFFNAMDVIIGDEIHLWKSDCVKGILDKSTEVKYRFGVTGSLDKSAINKMLLRGMLGEISQTKTTRDLIKEGFLSEIKINCIALKYSKDTKKYIKECDYKQEIDFITTHESRNRFVSKLALAQTQNTLILFNFISHGEVLYEQIKGSATTQKVHFIHGDIEADVREEIRLSVQNSTCDNIIVASFGVFSTGINLPRLHNIILSHPSKSIIRIMQSLGRGLRKSDDKAFLKVYDLCDAIDTTKTSSNYTYNHFIARLKLYTSEQHPYSLTEFILEK